MINTRTKANPNEALVSKKKNQNQQSINRQRKSGGHLAGVHHWKHNKIIWLLPLIGPFQVFLVSIVSLDEMTMMIILQRDLPLMRVVIDIV